MTELDPKGLEAARKEAHDLGLEALADPWAPYLGDIIRAYLDATRTSTALAELQRLGQECEREVDRLAVVCDAGGYTAMSHLTDARPAEWDQMEAAIVMQGGNGPFRRQIVRVHLLRPEPVAEVEGVTEDA